MLANSNSIMIMFRGPVGKFINVVCVYYLILLIYLKA